MRKKKNRGNKWEDHYSRKARKDKYPARSVYKLMEIQKKFKVIKKGDMVLDLGCAPGSWLLYAAEKSGNSGSVTGIDLKAVKIKVPQNVRTYEADILEPDESVAGAIKKDYSVILSDMAPATTGKKDIDAYRSYNLCMMALNVVDELLVTNGFFVCKIFQGGDFQEFIELVKNKFKKYKVFKPESCRKASKEIYIIGIEKK